MKQNWLDCISEEDFLKFIGEIWGDNYSISNANVVDGHLCERHSKNYGKYFDISLVEYYQTNDGSSFVDEQRYVLGQFGAVNATYDKEQNICLEDNVFPIKHIKDGDPNSSFLIAWIKFVAERTQGRKNFRGQTYYEDLTQKVADAVREQKLIVIREAEKSLRTFEAPFMAGLQAVGSNVPYERQNRFGEAHDALTNFRVFLYNKKQDEENNSFFS